MALAAATLVLAACGKSEAPATPETASAPAVEASEAAPASAPASEPVSEAPASAPVAAVDAAAGKSTYGKTCALCHAAGVAGAPKPGDKADWAPRIAQGKDTLYKHAIEGFTGSKGVMPARGGAASLTDDEVKAAVDFMADQSI